MLAIFPLQDWVALDKRFRRGDRNVERINYPADSDNHWKFRIHFNLQDLMQESELNVAGTGLLKDSSRFVKETAE